jgi:hypothetical protein
MNYIRLLIINTLGTQGNLGTQGAQLLNYLHFYDKFAAKRINPDN